MISSVSYNGYLINKNNSDNIDNDSGKHDENDGEVAGTVLSAL